MATTTNFGWETPDDTDLVKDGAAAIRTALGGVDTSFVDLKGGTTGQVLSKASNTDLDYTWVTTDDANAIQNAIVDAKGDLIAASAADTPARLAVGNNGETLVADSSTATGLKWAKSANYCGALLWRSTNQSIPNATWTAITFTDEDADTDSFHSTSTNTSRITIPTGLGGKYLFTGSVVWATNSTNVRALALYKNGGYSKALFLNAASPFFDTQQGYSTMVTATAGDYFELFTYQDAGVSVNVIAGADNTTFQTQYLGA